MLANSSVHYVLSHLSHRPHDRSNKGTASGSLIAALNVYAICYPKYVIICKNKVIKLRDLKSCEPLMDVCSIQRISDQLLITMVS